MGNNELPGNHGSTKEFHENIQYDIKDMFLNSLKESKSKGSLSISLGQTVIKLLKKEREREKKAEIKAEIKYYVWYNFAIFFLSL